MKIAKLALGSMLVVTLGCATSQGSGFGDTEWMPKSRPARPVELPLTLHVSRKYAPSERRIQIYRGYPFGFVLGLGRDGPPGRLAPLKAHGWESSLVLKLRDEADRLLPVAPKLTEVPPGPVPASGPNHQLATWRFSPSDTLAIPVGRYKVEATLSLLQTDEPGGWTGEVTVSADLEVVDVTEATPTEVRTLLLIDRIAWHSDRNELTPALADVEAWVALAPRSWYPRYTQGAILHDLGRKEEAIRLYRDALQLYEEGPPSDPPPSFSKARELMLEMGGFPYP